MARNTTTFADLKYYSHLTVLARKVAAQYAQSQIKTAMAVILRAVPGGINWGWFSNEDERMHLQTVNSGQTVGKDTYSVWLEREGKRIFEIRGNSSPIPAKVLKTLKAEVLRRRHEIEGEWLKWSFKRKWLVWTVVDEVVTLTLYPNNANKIVRHIDLRKMFPNYPKPMGQDDVAFSLEMNCLVIWPHLHESSQAHMLLQDMFWHD